MEPQGSSTLRRPYINLAVLVILVWAAVAYDIYDRHFSQDVADDTVITKLWGVLQHEKGKSYRLRAIIDGSRLMSYQPAYRVAVVCFRTDGTRDFQDIEDLQKSTLYDIHNSDMDIVFIVDADFLEPKPGVGGVYYAPFLIPKEMNMDRFSTIRQAKALGAIQLSGGLLGW